MAWRSSLVCGESELVHSCAVDKPSGGPNVVRRLKGQVVIGGYGWFAARMENRLDNSLRALPEQRGVAARSIDIGRIDLREIDQMHMSLPTMTERPA